MRSDARHWRRPPARESFLGSKQGGILFVRIFLIAVTTPNAKPRSVIDRAIRDHRAWKNRLKISIDTRGIYDQPIAEVRRDDRCPLGQWLKSLDDATRAGAHFKRVHKVHADFHHAAAAILELALAGKKTEAETALGPDGDFEELSRELVEALEAWRAEQEADAA
jgi:hypothetical protein